MQISSKAQKINSGCILNTIQARAQTQIETVHQCQSIPIHTPRAAPDWVGWKLCSLHLDWRCTQSGPRTSGYHVAVQEPWHKGLMRDVTKRRSLQPVRFTVQSFWSICACKAPTYQHPPSQNIYLGLRNSPYLDLQLMLNEASPKSDSISMECVERSSGWKPQLNFYGNVSPSYWEKTEQLIDGYQANIFRLGALMSLYQSSKSSLQNMSLKKTV